MGTHLLLLSETRPHRATALAFLPGIAQRHLLSGAHRLPVAQSAQGSSALGDNLYLLPTMDQYRLDRRGSCPLARAYPATGPARPATHCRHPRQPIRQEQRNQRGTRLRRWQKGQRAQAAHPCGYDGIVADGHGRIRLVSKIDRLRWDFGENTIDSFSSHVLETLSELESLLQEAATLSWTESPISLDGLENYSIEAKFKIEKLEKLVVQMDSAFKAEKVSLLNNAVIQEALKLAAQAKNFISAGLPVRLAELRHLNTSLAKYADWLAGLEDSEIEEFSQLESDMNLGNFCETVTKNRVTAETLLKETKRKHADFIKLRDQSYILAQQLREVASKILETKQNPDDCPLCHTSFGPGELLKHSFSSGMQLSQRCRDFWRIENSALEQTSVHFALQLAEGSAAGGCQPKIKLAGFGALAAAEDEQIMRPA